MKKIAIAASILSVLIVGGLFVMPHNSAPVVKTTSDTATPSEQTTTPTTSAPHETIKPQTTPTPKPVDTTKYYTAAEVSAHSDSSSCWSSINGKVYDLTSWIHQHPGGASAILRLCGTDGTEAFNGQHGGQARPEQELASFYIGVLKK